MEQGLIDIREKANKLAKKSRLGFFEPYPISCGTLIAILDELEAAQQSVQSDEGIKYADEMLDHEMYLDRCDDGGE